MALHRRRRLLLLLAFEKRTDQPKEEKSCKAEVRVEPPQIGDLGLGQPTRSCREKESNCGDH